LSTSPLPLTEWTYHSAGAYALTYRALLHGKDGGARHRVIVKELFPLGCERQEDGSVRLPFHMREKVERTFLREALTLNVIDSRHVPRLFYQRRALGNSYLVVEEVPGKPLLEWADRVLRRDRSSVAGGKLSHAFVALVETLAKLDAAGLVHGDIAPANIIVRDDGQPVIVDFGSAFSMLDPHLTNEPAHPGYHLPGAVPIPSIRRNDLFGLCASFYAILAGEPPIDAHGAHRALLRNRLTDSRRIDGTSTLVEAIDLGLSTAADPGAPAYDAAALSHFLTTGELPAPRPLAVPATNSWKHLAEEPAVSLRYQSCMLQSFDTPRFREDDKDWLRTRDNLPLATEMPQKLALARAEALLAICFGREIVVPAGQIADSPGFQAIFMEIMAAYLPKRHTIDAAFARHGLPDWRPFRVGLAQAGYGDYAGFTRAYRYTGAPLVLLEVTGGDADREAQTREVLETAIRLFNEGEFDQLGAYILKRTGRENYGAFTRTVSGYFDKQASIIARPDRPDIDTTEYAALFRARLLEEGTTGIDPEEVGRIMDNVTRIEAILAEKNLAGLRGNWYLFRKDFGASWQLARAYLDFRLYMNLAHQYTVDHPILVSQVVEANRYDHSIMMGPRFDAAGNDMPERDTRLMRLASQTVDRVKWDEVFEMFVDDRFIRHLVRMNRYYFGNDAYAAEEYQAEVRAHGAFLAAHATDFLKIDVAGGRVAASTMRTDAEPRDIIVDGIEGSMLTPQDPEDAEDIARSGQYGIGDSDYPRAAAAIAPLDRDGDFNFGHEAADYMLNYYFKPYRLALNRGI
jgi:serine/threonine protein kinase